MRRIDERVSESDQQAFGDEEHYCFHHRPLARMILKQGRNGVFWGCPHFPECRYTERAGDVDMWDDYNSDWLDDWGDK